MFTHTLTVLTCFGSHSRWCLWVLCNVVYCSRRELVGGKCTGRKTGNRLLNSVLTKIHRPKGTHLRLHGVSFREGAAFAAPSPLWFWLAPSLIGYAENSILHVNQQYKSFNDT